MDDETTDFLASLQRLWQVRMRAADKAPKAAKFRRRLKLLWLGPLGRKLRWLRSNRNASRRDSRSRGGTAQGLGLVFSFLIGESAPSPQDDCNSGAPGPSSWARGRSGRFQRSSPAQRRTYPAFCSGMRIKREKSVTTGFDFTLRIHSVPTSPRRVSCISVPLTGLHL